MTPKPEQGKAGIHGQRQHWTAAVPPSRQILAHQRRPESLGHHRRPPRVLADIPGTGRLFEALEIYCTDDRCSRSGQAPALDRITNSAGMPWQVLALDGLPTPAAPAPAGNQHRHHRPVNLGQAPALNRITGASTSAGSYGDHDHN